MSCKAARAARGRALATAELPRKADEKEGDPVLVRHASQGLEQPAHIPPIEVRAGVRHDTQLVRNREAHSHLAEIDGGGPHVPP